MEKKQFFLKEDGESCSHLCKFMNTDEIEFSIYIGSKWCGNECPHSFGYDFDNQFVKCELYSVYIERDKLMKKVQHLTNQLKKGSA